MCTMVMGCPAEGGSFLYNPAFEALSLSPPVIYVLLRALDGFARDAVILSFSCFFSVGTVILERSQMI